ncbi:phenylalanine--tRNA ligase subunit alpha [Candidatus Uhrbacteria bacterium RIFCSPHIGHO2_12_FULL_47_12]|uniref:Phenylalanine--tRNA ligase alpha subunit n=1 Tax=Candidatus Uhrbacteria bacterium RIFCSPLOWO2_02_FULL_48_18 TaxID=1802408 RepID=A0A1F7V8T5_9BACT|nr:MAG: phenylalanine--tRNA ligase subunit alpha [Candidatus Uhrbacteria bacterium RIFCSPHIGHO2_12_FULL_47_12]OGL86498.1 MAG: phenylalanine--tRNA ligase subunit alpha [Candidatus Uhrbacteria bacterium RIFCSPLOWO2_02_FULL_48_18]
MKSKIEQLKNDALALLEKITDRENLEALKTDVLGRKGKLNELMKEMMSLADDERKVIGQFANELKGSIENAFGDKERSMFEQEELRRAEDEWIDVTAPGDFSNAGHLHPITQAIADIEETFKKIGFTATRVPEIDWDYYVFESLNMPGDHPARDDWETFFVDAPEGSKGKLVLTPHTSNSQVRAMETQKPPIRMVNINRTYRRQSDTRHLSMFHQFEGLVVDRGMTIANLKGTIDYFAKTYFGPNRITRLRPHHFRFTEPSFEIDISCGVCNADPSVNCRLCKEGWMELGGAGMVHPNVLKAGGLDAEEFSGFAFGWGVERTMMMKEGMNIDDIRVLYKNDLRFVKQF